MARRQGRSKVQAYFEDKDRGFRRLASDLGGVAEVTIGVFGAAARKRHADSDLSVGTVAAMHEFGLGGMKRRPFVRAWMDKNTGQMVEDAKLALRAVALGMGRKEATEYLGKRWVGSIQSFIDRNQVRPENAPSTVKRKGHSTVMVGLTGTVRDSIGYKVKLPTTKTMRGTVKFAARRALDGIMTFNADSR